MSKDNPWVSIWVQPRSTIRRIVNEDPNRSLWLLAAIYGFSSLIGFFESYSFGLVMGAFPLLIMAIILAPVWGYLFFSCWSFVVSLTGRLFGGRGAFRSIRASYAWSAVPLALGDALSLFLILWLGVSMFVRVPSAGLFVESQAVVVLAFLLAKIVLSVWSLVIYINALAEVQQFSVFRAIGNLFVSALLVGIVIGIVLFFLPKMGAPVQSIDATGTAFWFSLIEAIR